MESFRLGGEGIHVLAKDPLLPQELIDTALRANLWQTMIDYDRLGREIWSGGKREGGASMPVPGLANTG